MSTFLRNLKEKTEEKFFTKTKKPADKKVIITGIHSTLGKYIKEKFLSEGWYVIGTYKNSDNPIESVSKNFEAYHLDLCEPKSIKDFAEYIHTKHPDFYALINNAGHVLTGPLEGTSLEQIRNQMDINFTGPVLLIQSLLPDLRRQKRGMIINISSLCGLTTFPILSLYHASKWALEGFSESLMYELEPFGIAVKIIEPGGMKENSYSSNVEFSEQIPEEYSELVEKIHKTNWFPSFSHPEDVAKQVFYAANDTTGRLRYAVGNDTELFVQERAEGLNDESCFTAIRDRIKV